MIGRFALRPGLTSVGILLGALAAMLAGPARAAEEAHPEIHRQHWSFGGVLGHFDDAQLQRGFKVYTEVCSRCHGVRRLAFRNLAQPGGPSFPEAAVKSLAATYEVDAEPNEEGKILKRPATLADHIPPPYRNDQEARFALNGALPPDLSLIVRARAAEENTPFYRVPDRMVRDVLAAYQEGGADYVYGYLTGYKDPPAGTKLADFMNYNVAFPGHQTAMPNPFLGGDGMVKYDDNTPATVDNYVRDVTAFLAWAADPRLEERKHTGVLVVAYIVLTALLLGLAKRRIWREVH
ncbi:MAG TPA: cytochrome c1 [Hyphomicrobiaceae bacterium]|jgi:cytochrome c1|nr:cytochrome c1 [Hyphomicrobiaceae bacterium]